MGKGTWTCALFACLLIAPHLHGQLTRGTLSGTVQDASGAVVPDALVKITNRATNITNESRSNAEGIYRFVAVEPGWYTVDFSKAGFDTRKVENVQVSTSQDVTLNQTLAISTAATTVQVIEAPAGVELAKSTATIERTLPQVFIESAALTGATRDITRLALLAPTVTRAPGSNEFSANGNRA